MSSEPVPSLTSIEDIDWDNVSIVNPDDRTPSQLAELGFEHQKISANKGPEYNFWGKLLVEMSTQNAGRTKERWTELRLWETPKGVWVLESVGCSDAVGQSDLTDVHIYTGTLAKYEVQTMANFDQNLRPEIMSREIQVMNTLGWSHLARAMAAKLGWNLTVVID